MKGIGVFVLTTACAAGTAMAADFDGSHELICAPVLAMDCAEDAECLTGTPAQMGAPAFIRVDAAKKTVGGARRSLPILQLERTTEQLLLQGADAGQAWAMVIDASSGRMYATITGRDGAIVMIGSCTPA
ncbi:MAG: hypothetical protein KBG29_06100 [Pseudomonadales bacterium]|nr:hypothetical protein [Pseudomonadales bacterium]MBP9033450.1 hypothetical protein [Pseudomonadales bacterium]